MSRQQLELTAKQLGYESAYDQAATLIKQELPGTDADDIPALARKVISTAMDEEDSISRVVAMRSFE